MSLQVIISKTNEKIEVRSVEGQQDIYDIAGNDAITLEMIPELDIYALASEGQYEEADYKMTSKDFGDLTNKYSLNGTAVLLALDTKGNYSSLTDTQVEAVRQLQEEQGGLINK